VSFEGQTARPATMPISRAHEQQLEIVSKEAKTSACSKLGSCVQRSRFCAYGSRHWAGHFPFPSGAPESQELIAFLADHNKQLMAEIADLRK